MGFEFYVFGLGFKRGWMGALRSCIGRRFFSVRFLGVERRVIFRCLKSGMALHACSEAATLERYYRRGLHVWLVWSYSRFERLGHVDHVDPSWKWKAISPNGYIESTFIVSQKPVTCSIRLLPIS